MMRSDRGRLSWDVDGRDWPLRANSCFISAAGLRWHVQIAGSGPVALLLHGTGAATHSWRDVVPALTPRLTVVSLDLPGHGFTGPLPAGRMSLPGMAAAVAELLATLGLQPEIAVGHSAGAAIAARMTLDRTIAPRAMVSINGAWLPFGGLAGLLFAPAAQLLALNPLVPMVFSWRAREAAAVRRLIASTGSVLDDQGIALYGRVVCNAAHVAGALAMMASWDLRPLQRDLPRWDTPLLLLAASNDKTVDPAQAGRVAASVRNARVVALAGLGHLAHEERPRIVADHILHAASGGTAKSARPATISLRLAATPAAGPRDLDRAGPLNSTGPLAPSSARGSARRG